MHGNKTVADTQSETASGQSTQFASMIEPDDGASSASVATTTTQRTATHRESESEDNPQRQPDPERLATLEQWSRQPRVVAGGSTIAAAMR